MERSCSPEDFIRVDSDSEAEVIVASRRNTSSVPMIVSTIGRSSAHTTQKDLLLYSRVLPQKQWT